MRQIFTDQFANLKLYDSASVSSPIISSLYDGSPAISLETFCQQAGQDMTNPAVEAFRQSSLWDGFQSQVRSLVAALKQWCCDHIEDLDPELLDDWDRFESRFLDPAIFELHCVHAYSEGKQALESILVHLQNTDIDHEKDKELLKELLTTGGLTVCEEGTLVNISNLTRDMQQNPKREFKAFVLQFLEQKAAELVNSIVIRNILPIENPQGMMIHITKGFLNQLLDRVDWPHEDDLAASWWFFRHLNDSERDSALRMVGLYCDEMQRRNLDVWLSDFVVTVVVPKLRTCNSEEKREEFAAWLNAIAEDDTPPLFFDPENHYALIDDEHLPLKLKITLYKRLLQSSMIQPQFQCVHMDRVVTDMRRQLDRSSNPPRFVNVEVNRTVRSTLWHIPGRLHESAVVLPGDNYDIVSVANVLGSQAYDWEVQQQPLFDLIMQPDRGCTEAERAELFMMLSTHDAPAGVLVESRRYLAAKALCQAIKAYRGSRNELRDMFKAPVDPTCMIDGSYPILLALKESKYDVLSQIIFRHPKQMRDDYRKILALVMSRLQRLRVASDLMSLLGAQDIKPCQGSDHWWLEYRYGSREEAEKLWSDIGFDPSLGGFHGYPIMMLLQEDVIDWPLIDQLIQKTTPNRKPSYLNQLSQVLMRFIIDNKPTEISVFNTLLEKDNQLFKRCFEGKYPVELAVENGRWQWVKKIIAMHDVRLLERAYKDQLTGVLQQAIEANQVSLVEKLVAQGIPLPGEFAGPVNMRMTALLGYSREMDALWQDFLGQLSGMKRQRLQTQLGQNFLQATKVGHVLSQPSTNRVSEVNKVLMVDSDRGGRKVASVLLNILLVLSLLPTLGLTGLVFAHTQKTTGSAFVFAKTRSAGLFHRLQQRMENAGEQLRHR